jgi:hypothetical protein
MTYAARQAEPRESPILHAAIALARKIHALGDEIEQARRVPAPIVDAMKQAGIFGMAMPHAWGGPELDPLTQFRVLEALAMADGSVGWCAMINCDGGYITSFMDQEVARAMVPQRLPHRQDRHCACPAAIASADASHSPAAVSIASGSGWVASSQRTERRWWMPTVCRRPGSVS